MKANELRIGNICEIYDAPQIYKEENGIIAIEAITIHYFVSGEDLKLRGVLLTEDWLIKFGFRKYNNKNHFKKHWVSGFININGIFCLLSYNQRHHNITYVHQLQNLYFALTNEELTIK